MRWSFGFVVWTLLGSSFALRTYLSALQNNINVSWKPTLSAFLVDFYLWGLASPVIFMFARRFGLRRQLFRNLLIHVGLSAVFSFAVLAVAAPVYWYVGYPNLARNPTLLHFFRSSAFSANYLHMGLTIYWMTLVVAYASYYYRGLREGETKAAQLAQAQLQETFTLRTSLGKLLLKDILKVRSKENYNG